VVKRFSIGYISDSWDGMMKAYSRNGQANEQLVELGMAIQGDKSRPYDRFRGRIMFPIRDKRGRVIGFGGRVLGDEKPKYLNSPETRVYHKGHELYGLYEAKQANKSLTRLVVVEGYMDVVALAQHGVDYAVASLGTATTTEQLQTMFRTVKEVICCYDGDRAGRDAAWRAMENALPLIRDGFSLKFVFVPDGEDPDSLIRKKGQQVFEKILDEAMPLSKFLFEQLMNQVDMSSSEGRAGFVESIKLLLAKLPDSVLKDDIINDVANNFGTGSEQFLTKFSKTVAGVSTIKKPKVSTKVTPVRLAIALLLEHPHIVKALGDISVLQPLTIPGVDLLTQLLELCQQNPNIKTAQLLEYFRDTEKGKQLAKLMCWQHHIEAEAAEDVFLDSIEKLLNNFVEQRAEFLLQKARTGQMSQQEKQELQAILNA
jgi:DNA primase